MTGAIRTVDGKTLTSPQYDMLQRLLRDGQVWAAPTQPTLHARERHGYAEWTVGRRKAISTGTIWTATAAGRAVIEARRR